MTTASNFDPSDIFYDLLGLTEMLGTIRDVIHEVDFDGGGRRVHGVNRVFSLVRIAEREVSRIRDAAQVFDDVKWMQGTTARPTDTPDDPILALIRDYRAALQSFNESASDEVTCDWDTVAGETFAPYLERLADWDQPICTREGAIAALRLAEDENNSFTRSPVAKPMIVAALAYLENAEKGGAA